MDGDTAAVRTVLAAGADVQCNDSDGYGRGRSGQLARESFDGAARGEVRTFDYCWHGRGGVLVLQIYPAALGVVERAHGDGR